MKHHKKLLDVKSDKSTATLTGRQYLNIYCSTGQWCLSILNIKTFTVVVCRQKFIVVHLLDRNELEREIANIMNYFLQCSRRETEISRKILM